MLFLGHKKSQLGLTFFMEGDYSSPKSTCQVRLSYKVIRLILFYRPEVSYIRVLSFFQLTKNLCIDYYQYNYQLSCQINWNCGYMLKLRFVGFRFQNIKQ